MNHKKRIGIIADSLNNEKTGIGQYLYNLLRYIAKFDRENEYFLINNKNESCGVCVNNFKLEIVDKTMPSIFSGSHPWHLTIPSKLKHSNFNLIFNPSQIPTFFRFNTSHIVTVLDLIAILFPKDCWFGKSTLYKLFLPRTLKNADKIIAISQNTKDDLIKHFNIPEEKIRVIYLAANKSYKLLPKEEINKIKIKYNLNYSFILYVGTLEPRKNIVRLIEAFYKARNENSINHKLVFTGRKGWKYENIFNKIKELNLEKDIIFTGYVSDEDLPALYNTADLFVYPSIYEGFGLPPLEAMACGTPVITSNVSSLPEVVGNAGIMVNPYNVNELADKITEVLTNEELKKELSQKGLERAKLFSWEKCAKETMEVFEEAINCEK